MKIHLAVIATISIQALLAFFMYEPKVGFDDANITQAYAKNIADGFGYVYNVHGERVEGSTSALWTAINAIAFKFENPLMILHAISFGITYLILLVTSKMTMQLTGNQRSAVISVLLFNLVPWLFGWWLYSLMDTGLFVLTVTSAIYFYRFSKSITCYVLLGCLPLVRPEGIAVALGLVALSYIGFECKSPKSLRITLLSFAVPIITFVLLTTARLVYFGYPFPNTFYAKTSQDVLSQITVGLRYIFSFYRDPSGAILIVLAAVGLINSDQTVGVGKWQKLHVGFCIAFFILGSFVYAILGGDHFNGFRFLHFSIPLLIVVAVFGLHRRVSFLDSKVKRNHVLAWLMIIFTAASTLRPYIFWGENNYAIEFRIAERGRQVGEKLDENFGGNFSVAVIAAGGVRMGFEGKLYDVLGLNWVSMAHSKEITTASLKNHGGFDEKIFWQATPDIAFPTIRDAYIPNYMEESAYLKGLIVSDRFVEEYDLYYGQRSQLLFYGHKNHSAAFKRLGFTLKRR